MNFTRYKIIKLLGEGASSTVYLAKDMIDNSEIAIKSIGNDKTVEHTILEKLNYEHIIKLKSFIKANSKTYLFIEKCDCNLIEFLNNYEFDMKGVKKIMRMVILGLAYIHDHQILHRDIKLGNILIKNDCIKICDFGLSCYEWNNDYVYCGTKDYLAPEIKCNQNVIYNNKVDVFAAGIVFKILISKKKEGNLENIEGVERNIILFLKKMLETDPVKRYSAREALKDKVFDELYADVPDFRLLKHINVVNKYGKIIRAENYVKFKFNIKDENTNMVKEYDNEIKIAYKNSSCNCRDIFIYEIYENNAIIIKEFLTNTKLKYYNYLCRYIENLCSKTPKFKMIENQISMTLFLNGSFLLNNENVKILKKKDSDEYIVNNEHNNISREDLKTFNKYKQMCIDYIMNKCVCYEDRTREHRSTIDISLNECQFIRHDSIIEKLEKKHIKEIGWCFKENFKFIFLINNGNIFKIDGLQQTICFENKIKKINKNVNLYIKRLLMIALKFLIFFKK